MRYIVEESGPRFITCRRVVEAGDETSALSAFARGEGDTVEGYPEIGEYFRTTDPLVGVTQHIVSEADDTTPLHLTKRELTLVRDACVGRLDRHARHADQTGYAEIKELLDGKLHDARHRPTWKKR